MRQSTRFVFQQIGAFIGRTIMSHPLGHLVPMSNMFSLPAVAAATATEFIEAMYDPDLSSFIGVFLNNCADMPDWAKRIAEWDRREFFKDSPGKIKLFGDLNLGDDGAGKEFCNWRYALELWVANGRQGPMPYTCQQDYGSCVDASAAEHTTTMLGWRAAVPALNEVFVNSAAWYWYADRGFCGDGWTGSACARVALARGIAFRKKYEIGGNSVDFSEDDSNEQIVARTWCRNGIPSWMAEHTQKNHAFEDGSITEFNGGVKELRALLNAGGTLHTGGVRTSGGPKPFTLGRTGPHMQSVIGGDDSERYKQFARDKIGVTLGENDFAVAFHQTWGKNWRGECADEFWPEWWGPKPEGAWVWKASDVVKYFDGDMMAWLPMFKGVANVNPVPQPPPPPGPTSNIIFNGQLTAIDRQTNQSLGEFILVPKPQVN